MTADKKKALKLVKRILSDRKHANEILELIPLLDGADEDVISISLKGLCTFFTKAIIERSNKKDQANSEEAKLYLEWVRSRYSEFWEGMIRLLQHNSQATKQVSLLTCVSLIEKEMVYMSKPNAMHVPEDSINMFLRGLILSDVANSEPELCKDMFCFVDLRYHVLKALARSTADLAKTGEEESMTRRVFNLLSAISEIISSESSLDDPSSTKSLCQGDFARSHPDFEGVKEDIEPATVVKAFDRKESRRVFGSAWLEFLKLDLSSHLFKSVLIILQNHIIPNFASPCLLADFLTRSFRQGGGIALLSLHGLFLLMTEHNLEYPQFYTHVYSMIHPRIFDAKYQFRFFYLLNIFLSSTHLPAYIVAAFVKKLSRLLLVSPAYAQQLLVNFILTLIDRHPNIKIMIHRSKSSRSNDLSMKTDPYLASQEDPALCKALDSSLWELLTLKQHFMPSVSSCVQDLNKGPNQDVVDLLEGSYENMFMMGAGDLFKEAPMNYSKPTSVFGGFEDSTLDLWSA